MHGPTWIFSASLTPFSFQRAAAAGVPGCAASGPYLADPFLSLAAAVNDTISSGYMDDRVWGSNLLLATDSPGHNAQPDVWGSGLAMGGSVIQTPLNSD